MVTSNENLDTAAAHENLEAAAAQVEPAMTLQTEEAKATAAEIVAANAALEETYQAVEAQAEATAEVANQLAEVTEEVVAELQEMKEGAGPA
jgi:hypothetical protein